MDIKERNLNYKIRCAFLRNTRLFKTKPKRKKKLRTSKSVKQERNKHSLTLSSKRRGRIFFYHLLFEIMFKSISLYAWTLKLESSRFIYKNCFMCILTGCSISVRNVMSKCDYWFVLYHKSVIYLFACASGGTYIAIQRH